jgi:integrase
MQTERSRTKLFQTGTPGVMYRGDDRNRKYYVLYRCYGACGKPEHAAKYASGRNPQHLERTYGDIGSARTVLAERKRQIEDKRAASQRGEAIIAPVVRTFSQVTDEYLEDRAFQKLAPGTQKKYRGALNLRVLPHFGEWLIADITTDDIASWLEYLRNAPLTRSRNGRTHGLSESALNGALSPLRCVFKFAAARSRQYIDVNPVGALEEGERPDAQTDARPVQVLDRHDLARLHAAAPDEHRFMLELKAGTGLRSGELRALVWGDIDLDRKRIKISRQIDTHDKGERVAIKDRGLSDWRNVPLTDALAHKLRDLKARMAEYNLSEADAFVFGGEKHVTHERLDRVFRRAVRNAGIERDPGKRLSPHSLRHTFGSLLIADGEPLVNVSRWLGHRKISTTERWYVHQIESADDLAAERMRERVRLASSVASTA